MNVSKDLDGRLEVLDQDGLSLEHQGDLIDEFKHLFPLNVEWSHQWGCSLAFLWLEEVLDEEGVKRLVMVFLDERSFNVRSKFLRLFL